MRASGLIKPDASTGGSSGGDGLTGIYGLLATACGYSPAQIDEMDWSEWQMLSAYWADHPPPHLLIAGYFGIKPKKRAEPEDDFAEILGNMPGWSKRTQ